VGLVEYSRLASHEANLTAEVEGALFCFAQLVVAFP